MITRSITWEPLFPVMLVLLAGTAILVVLVMLELRRKQRFPRLRYALQFTVVLCLVGLTLRPRYADVQANKKVLLLTRNFQRTVADSLVKKDPGLEIIRTMTADEFPGATILTTWNEVAEKKGSIEYVLGEGLPLYVLDMLGSEKFHYFPATEPEGIINLHYPNNYTVNRWNRVSGVYHEKTGQHLLILQGPGGIDDSLRIQKQGHIGFKLDFFPKTPGRHLYRLIDQDSSGNETVSTLPIEVLAEKKLNILFVTEYPTFEQKYLKNFLGRRGHRTAVRNRVSRNQFRYEFANRSPLGLNAITESLLNEMDLLIIDSHSFSSLPQKEKQAILEALNHGLGLLILNDDRPSEKEISSGQFRLQRLAGRPDTVRINLEGEGYFTLPRQMFETKEDHLAILKGQDETILAGYKFVGLGKTGFQFVADTYQLGLREKPNAYASIWVPLLEALAREIQEPYKLMYRTPFPWVANDPISLEISSAEGVPVLLADSVRVPMIEDVEVDGYWHGKIWLEGEAWHSLTVDSSQFHLPIVKASEWNSLTVSRQLNNTRLRDGVSGSGEGEQIEYRDAWIPIIFFAVFLLASGLLWLVPKT